MSISGIFLWEFLISLQNIIDHSELLTIINYIYIFLYVGIRIIYLVINNTLFLIVMATNYGLNNFNRILRVVENLNV